MTTQKNTPDAPTGNFKFGGKRDVASMLVVCPRTVDNLMERGLPHLKLGKRAVRFDMEEVRAWAKREFGSARTGKVGAH
ncbi:MAG: DNA-binding protein [Proteobacteria bacterium]|nr:DNA-binding protein [Pseudomonadota bacterium]